MLEKIKVTLAGPSTKKTIVDGWTDPVNFPAFAITKSVEKHPDTGRKWRVTHINTGYAVDHGLRTKKIAEEYAIKLYLLYPKKWEKTTRKTLPPEKIQKASTELYKEYKNA